MAARYVHVSSFGYNILNMTAGALASVVALLERLAPDGGERQDEKTL